MTRFIIVFVWGLYFLQSAFAEAQNVAVLEYRGVGISEDIVLNLSDQTRAAAVQSLSKEEYLIFTRENMMQILDDMGKDASCIEGACEVDIGRSIGADILVTGDVLSVNSVYVLNLKLYETKTGRLLATQEVQNEDLLKLKEETFLKSKDLFEQGLGSSKKMITPLLKQKRHFFVDMSGGIGFGGVTQTFLWAIAYAGDPIEDLFYPFDSHTVGGVSSGTASLFGGAFGIAFDRMDVSLYGGVLNGKRILSYAQEFQDLNGDVIQSGSEELLNEANISYLLEPKIRVYFRPNQNLKPYVLASRYWQVGSEEWGDEYSYGVDPVVHHGVSVGGGVQFSAPKQESLNIFLEVPWTYVYRHEGLITCSNASKTHVSLCDLYDMSDPDSDFYMKEISRQGYEDSNLLNHIGRIQLGVSFYFN